MDEKDKVIKKELKEELDNFMLDIEKTFIKELKENGAIGSISELYDSKAPHLPKGAIAQGWSVSEIFRILVALNKKE